MANIKQCSDRNALRFTLLSFSVMACFALLAVPAGAQQLNSNWFTQMRYRTLGPQGNRADAIVGEPGNPMVDYVGAASGGIFKTTDGGLRWTPIFDKEDVMSIGALAIAPSAHNIVWAGTGEPFYNRVATSIGNGIYKSTDGGATWKHMGLENTGRIARIVVDPTNPDIVFAAAVGSGFAPSQDRGVFRTTDGGKTWQRVLFVDENTGAADVAMDAHNPQTLLAGTWQLTIHTWDLHSGGPGSGIFLSHDGGTTWTRVVGHGFPTHPIGKTAVAIAPSDGERMYALVQDKHPGFYRSDDGGQSWRLVSENDEINERSPYYNRFTVDPVDEDRIYFVTVGITRSLDGGATDHPFGGGGDNHDFWIDPTDPNRMMIAHDGGASITLNRGASWQSVNLPIAQLYHVTTDDAIPYFVYANEQDNGSWRIASNSWGGGISAKAELRVGGCESGFTVPDKVNNEIVYSGCYDGGLDRFDLKTLQTRDVKVWPVSEYGWTPADVKYRWNWTFPIAISPNDDNAVYVGSQFVHETTNGGASWKEISPDLTRNDKTSRAEFRRSLERQPFHLRRRHAMVHRGVAQGERADLGRQQRWSGARDAGWRRALDGRYRQASESAPLGHDQQYRAFALRCRHRLSCRRRSSAGKQRSADLQDHGLRRDLDFDQRRHSEVGVQLYFLREGGSEAPGPALRLEPKFGLFLD